MKKELDFFQLFIAKEIKMNFPQAQQNFLCFCRLEYPIHHRSLEKCKNEWMGCLKKQPINVRSANIDGLTFPRGWKKSQAIRIAIKWSCRPYSSHRICMDSRSPGKRRGPWCVLNLNISWCSYRRKLVNRLEDWPSAGGYIIIEQHESPGFFMNVGYRNATYVYYGANERLWWQNAHT